MFRLTIPEDEHSNVRRRKVASRRLFRFRSYLDVIHHLEPALAYQRTNPRVPSRDLPGQAVEFGDRLFHLIPGHVACCTTPYTKDMENPSIDGSML